MIGLNYAKMRFARAFSDQSSRSDWTPIELFLRSGAEIKGCEFLPVCLNFC